MSVYTKYISLHLSVSLSHPLPLLSQLLSTTVLLFITTLTTLSVLMTAAILYYKRSPQ